MQFTLRLLAGCAVILAYASATSAQSPYGAVAGPQDGPPWLYPTPAVDSMNAPTGIHPVQGTIASSPPPPQPGVYTPHADENLGCYPTDGPWGTAAVYGWVFGMDGTLGVGARTVNVDMSVQDAFDLLSDLKGAAMLHLEGGYGSFGVILDLLYMELAPSGDNVQVSSKTIFAEALGLYRVVDTGRCAGGIFFDVLAGARYYRFRNEVQITTLDITSYRGSTTWYDLVVGARAGVQLLDCLGVWVRSDVGGFGIGESSDRAYNLIAGFDLQCSECVFLAGGYRWLKIDRTSGAGTDRRVIDVTMSGPFLGLGVRY
jgi:hypothetical protein